MLPNKPRSKAPVDITYVGPPSVRSGRVTLFCTASPKSKDKKRIEWNISTITFVGTLSELTPCIAPGHQLFIDRSVKDATGAIENEIKGMLLGYKLEISWR